MLRSHGRTELMHTHCCKEAAEADGEAKGGWLCFTTCMHNNAFLSHHRRAPFLCCSQAPHAGKQPQHLSHYKHTHGYAFKFEDEHNGVRQGGWVTAAMRRALSKVLVLEHAHYRTGWRATLWA